MGVCAQRVDRAARGCADPSVASGGRGASQGSLRFSHPSLRPLTVGLPLHRLHDLRLPHSGQALLHLGPDER